MVNVAVGVIKKGNKVFLTYRNENQHQGNKWEFPGGKIEAKETAEQALIRELNEEVGIVVSNPKTFLTIKFDYKDKKVCLEVFLVEQFEKEPKPQEGQNSKWICISELESNQFPEANGEIINKLKTLI